MKINEFGRVPDEFAKRPRELHTVKQTLTHGSEINTVSGSPAKRKRKSVSDMLKFAVASVASAAVVVVAAPAVKPVETPTVEPAETSTVKPVETPVIQPDETSAVQEGSANPYKSTTLIVPANTDCFIVTGMNDFPLNKLKSGSTNFYGDVTKDDSYVINCYYPVNIVGGRCMWNLAKNSSANKIKFLGSLNKLLDGNSEALSGTAPMYYDLLAMNFETETKFRAPQMSRVLPIEDDYYIFRLNLGGGGI